MKNKFLLLCGIALTLMSCEEVIILDFNDAEPKLVIEAFITNEAGPYRVELNESARFYDDSVFPPRTGAYVVIADDQGNSDILTEVEAGVYLTSTIHGQPGVTYTLTVESEGETYTASSTMPSTLVPIQSLNVRYEENPGFFDPGYYVGATIQDPEELGNTYRSLFFQNGEAYVSTDDDGNETDTDRNFYLDDDKFWNGNEVDLEFFKPVELGDTITVELHHLDPQTYDYYRTLVDAINGGGVAPSDPLSNFGDQALGYFGAFSVSRMEVVVE